MKNDANLFFKRWASRPAAFDSDKITLLRKIFWVDYSEEINDYILLENWDECTITGVCVKKWDNFA